LGYPGGPEVERMAKWGNAAAYDFPRSMLQHSNFDFSFSGLKTAVRIEVQRMGSGVCEQGKADICASFQQAVIEILLAKTWRACKAVGVKKITVSGGVSCNGTIREAFEANAAATGMECLFAPPRLSTDNAIMIAAVAAGRFGEGQMSSWNEDADPNLKLVQSLPFV
jgi:N6-L-threonylcarbamoyladenine synthase